MRPYHPVIRSSPKTYCRKLLSVPCLSGKCAQMSIERGFGVRASVCMCLAIRVVIRVVNLEFEFM